MATNGVPTADVCPSHEDLIKNISSLCVQLKLMFSLGLVMIPLFCYLSYDIILRTNDLRTEVKVMNMELQQIKKELKK